MTRTINTNTLAKVDDEQVTMINMVQCNFASGTFYANSTAQSIVYASKFRFSTPYQVPKRTNVKSNIESKNSQKIVRKKTKSG